MRTLLQKDITPPGDSALLYPARHSSAYNYRRSTMGRTVETVRVIPVPPAIVTVVAKPQLARFALFLGYPTLSPRATTTLPSPIRTSCRAVMILLQLGIFEPIAMTQPTLTVIPIPLFIQIS